MEDDKPKIVQQSFKTFGNSQAPNSVKVSEGIDIKSENELTIKDSSGNVVIDYNNPHLPFMVLKSMNYDYAKPAADGEYLAFVCPNVWNDPFEYLFYDENRLQGRLYCLCTSLTRAENEEAMWKIYGGSSKQQNILCLNLCKLLHALSDCQVLDSKSSCLVKPSNGIQFFVAPINYSLTKKELLRERSTFAASAPGLNNTISYMTCKRKAFKYEDELRFLLTLTIETSLRIIQTYYVYHCPCSTVC